MFGNYKTLIFTLLFLVSNAYAVTTVTNSRCINKNTLTVKEKEQCASALPVVIESTTSADIFKWSTEDLGTPGTPMEYIVNNFHFDWYTPSDNDTINLSGLNIDSTSPTFSPTLHLFIAIEAGNTVISVSSAGGYTAGFDAAATDLKITLISVDFFALVGGMTEQNAVINDLLTNQLLVF
jgi:hypothetical protein